MTRIVVRSFQGAKQATKGQVAIVYNRLPAGHGYTPGGVASAYKMRPSVIKAEFERRVLDKSMAIVDVAKPVLMDYEDLKKLTAAPLREEMTTIYVKVK